MKIRGRALIMGDNVNTDVLHPSRFYSLDDRKVRAGFLQAAAGYEEIGGSDLSGRIIVAGENFGCGSSREHAPWALLDAGIRCVIAPSFADIFYNNCFKNGILPIRVAQEDLDKLFDDADRGANATLTVDLEKQEIRGPDGGKVKFDIDPHRKHCLLNGLDDISLTLQSEQAIAGFESARPSFLPRATV